LINVEEKERVKALRALGRRGRPVAQRASFLPQNVVKSG